MFIESVGLLIPCHVPGGYTNNAFEASNEMDFAFVDSFGLFRSSPQRANYLNDFDLCYKILRGRGTKGNVLFNFSVGPV